MSNHYAGLVAGYGLTVAIVWILALRAQLAIFKNPLPEYRSRWIALALYALMIVLVLLIGQMFTAGLLLPDQGLLFKSLNQIAIFSPILLFLAWGRAPEAAFLPLRRALPSIGLGIVLAMLAVVAYLTVRGNAAAIGEAAAFVASPQNIPHAVQVLLEDIAIALLLGLLATAFSARIAVAAVAMLFAVAHIPAIIAGGGRLADFGTLGLDAALGILVMGAILWSRNIWWFWPIHTVMDLMQFFQPD